MGKQWPREPRHTDGVAVLAGGILGQVLHQPALQGEPQGPGSKEQDGLTNQAEGDPLVEGVEHLEANFVAFGFPTSPPTSSLSDLRAQLPWIKFAQNATANLKAN